MRTSFHAPSRFTYEQGEITGLGTNPHPSMKAAQETRGTSSQASAARQHQQNGLIPLQPFRNYNRNLLNSKINPAPSKSITIRIMWTSLTWIPMFVRIVILRARIVSWRFQTILNLHISLLNDTLSWYDRFMYLALDKFFTRNAVGAHLVLRKIMKKGMEKEKATVKEYNTNIKNKKKSGTVGKHKLPLIAGDGHDATKEGHKDDDSWMEKSSQKELGDDDGELERMKGGPSFSKRNVIAMKRGVKCGLALLVLSLIYMLLFVAFLPFWMTLFCVFSPCFVITEVVGVLAIAVIQSCDPRIEKEFEDLKSKPQS